MKKSFLIIAFTLGLMVTLSSCGGMNDKMTWDEFTKYVGENPKDSITLKGNYGIHNVKKGTGKIDDVVGLNYFVCDYSITSLTGEVIEKKTDVISQIKRLPPFFANDSGTVRLIFSVNVATMTEGEVIDFYITKDEAIANGVVDKNTKFDVLKFTVNVKEVAKSVVAEYKNPKDGKTFPITIEPDGDIELTIHKLLEAGVDKKSITLDESDGQGFCIINNIVMEGKKDVWLLLALRLDYSYSKLLIDEIIFNGKEEKDDSKIKTLTAPASMFKCLKK